MRRVELSPQRHLLVCANVREASSPLGPGCGDAGERVYDALKREVSAARLDRSVWVARTRCLGVCPKRGATVIVHPGAQVFADVEPSDASSLLQATPDRSKSGP